MLKAKTIYSKEYSITMISPAEQTGGSSINLIYILMPVMLQFLQQDPSPAKFPREKLK